MKNFIRALLAALLLATTTVFAADLWLTSAGGLYRVDADRQSANWIGPVADDERVLAARGDAAWLLGSNTIQLIDGEGNPLHRFASPGRPDAVAVDAANGTLHIVTGGTLESYFQNGERRSLAMPAQACRSIATANGEEFWLLTPEGMMRYKPDAGWQNMAAISELPYDRIAGLAIDPVRKGLWLIGDRFVYHLREVGGEPEYFELPLTAGDILGYAFDTEKLTLWLGTATEIWALDAKGQFERFAHGLDLRDGLQGLLLDGESARLWLVSGTHVRAWTHENANVLDLDLWEAAWSASARAMSIEPALSLESDDADETKSPFLALALRCGQRLCEFPEGIPRGLRLMLQIDLGPPQALTLDQTKGWVRLDTDLLADAGYHLIEAWLEGNWFAPAEKLSEWIEMGANGTVRRRGAKATNQPPSVSITAPAANAVFLAPATVSISATASDSDGTVSKVEFYQGTKLLGSKTTSPYTFSWTNVARGNYALTAKATDNKGASTTSAALNIVVNQAPTVSLTAPANNASFNAGANIAITASASDADGSIAKVEFYQGATLLGSKTTSPYTITWSNAPAGSYTLTVKATDNRGAVATSAVVSIKVNAVAAPSVSLTAPADGTTVLATVSVTLKATAKSTGSTISTVDFYDGTTLLGTVKGTSATLNAQISKSGFAAGTHTLTALATDALGQKTTSAAIKLNVQALGPVVQVTAPLEGALLGRGSEIYVEAAASSNQGSITMVELYDGATQITSFNSKPYAIYWQDAAVGAHTLTAKATDSKGATAVSAPVNITVSNSMAPTISLGITGESYHVPATFALTADASDPDGSISKVEFFEGTHLLAMLTQAPYRFVWSGVAAGTYGLWARATDDAGLSTGTDVTTLVVDATVPTVAIAFPTEGSTVWLVDSVLTVSGSFTGPPGTTISVVIDGNEMLAQTSGQQFSLATSVIENSDAKVVVRAQTLAGAAAEKAVNFKALFPRLWITDPQGDAEVFSDHIALQGIWQAPKLDSITVAGQTAQIAGAEFKIDAVPLALGENILQATMALTMPDATKITVGATRIVKRLAPSTRSVAIDTVEPFDATKVGGLPMLARGYRYSRVSGPVTGGAETQVLIDNGRDSRVLATMSNGRFSAPIAVLPGENIVTATAIGPSGSPVSVSKTVYGASPAGQNGALVRVSAPTSCTAYPTAPANISLVAEVMSLSASAIALVEFSAPEVGVIGQSNAAPYAFEWKNVPAGVYHVRARVPGSFGPDSFSPAVTIAVGNSISCLLIEPRAGFGTDYIAPANIVVTAKAEAFGSNVDKVEFLLNDTQLLGTASVKPYVYNWQNVSPGGYRITAKAMSKSGAVATSTANVNVATLGVTLRGWDADYGLPLTALGAPASVVLQPDPSVTGRALDRIEFYAGANKIGSVAASPYTFTWSAIPPGDYSVTARAVGSNGASADSAPVAVHVAPLFVRLSLAGGGPFTEPGIIGLYAQSKVWQGSVARIGYYANDQLIGSGSGTDSVFTWSNVPGGSYTVIAKVFDKAGNSAASLPLTVKVIGPPTVKLIAPLEGASAGTGGSVLLEAQADAPGSSISTVEFYQGSSLLGTRYGPPWQYNWSNLPQGDFTLTAVARNPQSMSATSAPVHIHVTDTPAASITAPADQQMIANGQPINITVEVSMPKRTIDHVDILADGALLGTVSAAGGSQFSADFSWTNAPVGEHTLTATAYAKDGTKVDAAAVKVTMLGPIKIALESPFDGAVALQSEPVHVSARVSEEAGSIAAVQFYAGDTLVGTVNAAPYAYTWSNAPVGNYLLTARAIDAIGQIVGTPPALLRVIDAPSIELDAGIENASVDDDHISVTGRVTAPTNSALTIAGQGAAINGAGSFFINDFALNPGSNVLALTLNSLNGQPVTKTFNVTSNKTAPFTVSLIPDRGIAPFSSQLIITNRGGIAFRRIEVDTDGNGSADQVLQTLQNNKAVIPVEFDNPGTYELSVKVFDEADSVIYAAKRRVYVYSAADVFSTASFFYTSMLGRLRAGDVDHALQYLAPEIRSAYGKLFTALGSNLKAAVDGLGSIYSVTAAEEYAVISIVRTQGDKKYGYEVTMTPGDDGLWRISGM